MVSLLRYRNTPELDSERADFIRRTRTICIYTDVRPDIPSKSLVAVNLTSKCGTKSLKGTFCVDALGSKKGFVIGHPSHFEGLDNDEEVELSIAPASAHDCVNWLEQNDDPERKAFSHILKNTLDATGETRRVAVIAQETLETTKKNLEEAERQSHLAKEDKKDAIKARKLAPILAAAGFGLGAVLDIGMLETKFGFIVPPVAIVSSLVCGAFVVSVFLWLGNDP